MELVVPPTGDVDHWSLAEVGVLIGWFSLLLTCCGGCCCSLCCLISSRKTKDGQMAKISKTMVDKAVATEPEASEVKEVNHGAKSDSPSRKRLCREVTPLSPQDLRSRANIMRPMEARASPIIKEMDDMRWRIRPSIEENQ